MADAYAFVEKNKTAVMKFLTQIDLEAQRRQENTPPARKRRHSRGVAYRYRAPQSMKMIDLAMLPTLRNAAMRGGVRNGRIDIKRVDIQEKVRRIRKPNLVTILLDSSASADKIISRKTIEAVNRAVLLNTYQKRDRVSMIECRGRRAHVAQRFTVSFERAQALVQDADFRGQSPLASGLMAAGQLFQRERTVEPDAVPTLIVISDGEANAPYRTGMDINRELHLLMTVLEEHGFFILFIDISEKGSSRLEELAEHEYAYYYHAMEHNPRRRFFMPVLGEELTKEALILSSINPRIRGILLYGSDEIVHAKKVSELSKVLPDIDTVTDCPYNCDPGDEEHLCAACLSKLEDLPPGRKLPRSRISVPIIQLHGDADLDEMAGGGVPGGVPGVFGMANRGILFVDNIHDLDDEKKEILIQAMDTGEVIFRKSEDHEIRIPANFRVVATITGNVQAFHPIDRRLFDYFDVRLELKDARRVSDKSIDERIETIKQAIAFESDPLQYRQKIYTKTDVDTLIVQGQELLPKATVGQAELTLIARLNEDFGNAGYEVDVSITRIARTIAAMEGKKQVEVEHVKKATEMTYRFRNKADTEHVETTSNIELLKSLVRNYAKE